MLSGSSGPFFSGQRVQPSQRGREVLAVPGLSRILFFVFFSLGFFGKKEMLDVPRIQRAVVTEHQAIVYKKPILMLNK